MNVVVFLTYRRVVARKRQVQGHQQRTGRHFCRTHWFLDSDPLYSSLLQLARLYLARPLLARLNLALYN